MLRRSMLMVRKNTDVIRIQKIRFANYRNHAKCKFYYFLQFDYDALKALFLHKKKNYF